MLITRFSERTQLSVNDTDDENLNHFPLVMQVRTKIPAKTISQRGARTHDPQIKSLMLYRLS